MRAMPRFSRGILIVSMVIVASTLAYQLFRPLKDSAAFAVPTAAEFDRAEASFLDLLAEKPGAKIPTGLLKTNISDWPNSTLYREKEGECLGRGGYLLRRRPPIGLALTAPHRASDRHTGTLAIALFGEGEAAAVAWNSAPRRPTKDCKGGGDPARHETHYLTAFSSAFAKKYPQGRVVQLHGFDRMRRETTVARNADIIVSDGSDEPSSQLLDLADCLSINLRPLRVAVYPMESKELGALQNKQGQVLRAEGFKGFAHIEIAAETRQSLIDDGDLRAAFRACLESGLKRDVAGR
ncbi:hypothetical protein GCM10023115_04360 [Pontixanthobacter gangjinensis]